MIKGQKMTEEQRKRLSEAKKGKGLGRKLSEEHRRHISEGQLGNKRGPLSEEHKMKLSKLFKGRQSEKKGIPLSEEQKKKISDTLKGRIRPPRTPEWNENQRRSQLGKQKGKKHHNWKGGISRKPSIGNYLGAILIRCPEEYSIMKKGNGYVSEHRLIMARILKRPLLKSEVVHHVNGNPLDNRPENLMLFSSNSEHNKYHQKEKKK